MSLRIKESTNGALKVTVGNTTLNFADWTDFYLRMPDDVIAGVTHFDIIPS